MLLNSHDTNDNPDAPSRMIYTLLLFDGHGAYGFGDSPAHTAGGGWSGPYFEVTQIWDSYQFSDLEPTMMVPNDEGHAQIEVNGSLTLSPDYKAFEDRVKAAFDLVFEGIDLDDELLYARDNGSLLALKAGTNGLLHAFHHLADELDPAMNEYAISGDDDSFDYWPSGWSMLKQLANDICIILEDAGAEGEDMINRRMNALEAAARIKAGDFADEILS